MIGDNSSKVILLGVGWGGELGGGGQVPGSHLPQLATGPHLPAPHAGHVGILLCR